MPPTTLSPRLTSHTPPPFVSLSSSRQRTEARSHLKATELTEGYALVQSLAVTGSCTILPIRRLFFLAWTREGSILISGRPAVSAVNAPRHQADRAWMVLSVLWRGPGLSRSVFGVFIEALRPNRHRLANSIPLPVHLHVSARAVHPRISLSRTHTLLRPSSFSPTDRMAVACSSRRRLPLPSIPSPARARRRKTIGEYLEELLELA
ncbi:hypothetical protein C8F01DRAFT_1376025 [Mycena amicta]|nr:hypothetical protein C8F01DRAFT_1376025 [Mycena amicta]